MITGMFFFEFPGSLQFLETDHCKEGPVFPKLFTGLKTLVIRKRLSVYRDTQFLQAFPNLKELFLLSELILTNLVDWLQSLIKSQILTSSFVESLTIISQSISSQFPKFGKSYTANRRSVTDPRKSIKGKTRFFIENLSSLPESNHLGFKLDYSQLDRLNDKEIDEIYKEVGKKWKKVAALSLDRGVANQARLFGFLRERTPLSSDD